MYGRLPGTGTCHAYGDPDHGEWGSAVHYMLGGLKMWQDLVLSVVGLLFTIMLIPQLNDATRGKAVLNFWTCLVTGAGCVVIGCVDITLNLPLAMVVSISTGIMWLALMYYSEENRKKEKIMKMVHEIPDTYINPRARDIPVRDQGERDTSVGMSAAMVMDLIKRENEELN